ncbi:MAG: hypothetical protein ACNFW9_05480 [Candidatus Kerfeldbacteria bacterium]|jgi:hypothetical protein
MKKWFVAYFKDDPPSLHSKFADQKIADFANQHNLESGEIIIYNALEKSDHLSEVSLLYYAEKEATQ